MRHCLAMITLLLMLGALLQGCSETLGPTRPEAGAALGLSDGLPLQPGASAEPAVCGEPCTVTLVAERGTPIGAVTVSNDETTLWITIRATDGWVLHTTQMEVRPAPGDAEAAASTGRGGASGLRLTEKHKPPVASAEHSLDLTAARLASGDKLQISVHALVSNLLSGRSGRARLSAWACDLQALSPPGKKCFEYFVQMCDPEPGCDLALLWPLGGETLCAGYTYLVAWDPIVACADSVSIELLFAGEPCQTISAATPNDGEFEWEAVSPCAGDPEGYGLRITDLACGCRVETAETLTIEDCGTGE